MHRLAPPQWRLWTTPEVELARDERSAADIRTVLVPHCHGYVCLLDPATTTAYVSLEFDALTRARSLCQAIEEYQKGPQRARLALAPPPAADEPDEDVLAESC